MLKVPGGIIWGQRGLGFKLYLEVHGTYTTNEPLPLNMVRSTVISTVIIG